MNYILIKCIFILILQMASNLNLTQFSGLKNPKDGFKHAEVIEGGRITNMDFFKQDASNTSSRLGGLFYTTTIQTNSNNQQNQQSQNQKDNNQSNYQQNNNKLDINSDSFSDSFSFNNDTQKNSYQQKVDATTTKSFSNKVKNEKFAPALHAISAIINKSQGIVNEEVLKKVAFQISNLGLTDNDFQNGNRPENVSIDSVSTVIYDKNQASVVAQVINKTFDEIKQGKISILQAQQQFAGSEQSGASR